MSTSIETRRNQVQLRMVSLKFGLSENSIIKEIYFLTAHHVRKNFKNV